MNLKESFRYQKFLYNLLEAACQSIRLESHALTTVQLHKRSLVKEDALDETKVVEKPDGSYQNDDVLSFIELLILERGKLTIAIDRAKYELSKGFDVDAAIETNKFRQKAAASIQMMLQYKEKTYLERGTSYAFNANGEQAPYYYDVEVTKKTDYDRERAKRDLRDMVTDADEVSSRIDAAMINTEVEYEPLFNVNESFEDAMEVFIALKEADSSSE